MQHTYLSKISLISGLLIVLLLLNAWDLVPFNFFEANAGPLTWMHVYLILALMALSSGIAALITERSNNRAKWYAISGILMASVGPLILHLVPFIILLSELS